MAVEINQKFYDLDMFMKEIMSVNYRIFFEDDYEYLMELTEHLYTYEPDPKVNYGDEKKIRRKDGIRKVYEDRILIQEMIDYHYPEINTLTKYPNWNGEKFEEQLYNYPFKEIIKLDYLDRILNVIKDRKGFDDFLFMLNNTDKKKELKKYGKILGIHEFIYNYSGKYEDLFEVKTTKDIIEFFIAYNKARYEYLSLLHQFKKFYDEMNYYFVDYINDAINFAKNPPEKYKKLMEQGLKGLKKLGIDYIYNDINNIDEFLQKEYKNTIKRLETSPIANKIRKYGGSKTFEELYPLSELIESLNHFIEEETEYYDMLWYRYKIFDDTVYIKAVGMWWNYLILNEGSTSFIDLKYSLKEILKNKEYILRTFEQYIMNANLLNELSKIVSKIDKIYMNTNKKELKRFIENEFYNKFHFLKDFVEYVRKHNYNCNFFKKFDDPRTFSQKLKSKLIG